MTKFQRNQKAWENELMRQHLNPPAPFNPHYRPGFGEACSKAYAAWCEEHPQSSQAERKAAYAEIADRLTPEFPTVG